MSKYVQKSAMIAAVIAVGSAAFAAQDIDTTNSSLKDANLQAFPALVHQISVENENVSEFSEGALQLSALDVPTAKESGPAIAEQEIDPITTAGSTGTETRSYAARVFGSIRFESSVATVPVPAIRPNSQKRVAVQKSREKTRSIRVASKSTRSGSTPKRRVISKSWIVGSFR